MSKDIDGLEGEIARLRERLAEREAEVQELRQRLAAGQKGAEVTSAETLPLHLPSLSSVTVDQLSRTDIAKFSRQIILPEIAVAGQKALKGSSVLVVGCGGLGCPASLYLVGAGVGRIGLVDYDTVEISNLHRQVLHSEATVGEKKCVSAARALTLLNSDCQAVPIHAALNRTNALELVKQFDVVLDCTDNVATRYLLNDACVLAGRPLVSGSALRWEGQLTVYNYLGTGPTYRCLYPVPPPPTAVTNCSEGGVVGVVPGIIGSLQALEAIKILLPGQEPGFTGKMLLFDAQDGTFRTVKLRGRVAADGGVRELVDYEQFCGAAATDKDTGISLLQPEDRITAVELDTLLRTGGNEDTEASKRPVLLVDVRTGIEAEMCQIPGSEIVPLPEIEKGAVSRIGELVAGCQQVVVVCRRGNDSQRAVVSLRSQFPSVRIRDVTGGLHAWAKLVDPEFPVY